MWNAIERMIWIGIVIVTAVMAHLFAWGGAWLGGYIVIAVGVLGAMLFGLMMTIAGVGGEQRDG